MYFPYLFCCVIFLIIFISIILNVYKINVIKSYKRYIPAIILLIAIILYENDIKNAAISLPNIIDK